jgi:hypothetical protein
MSDLKPVADLPIKGDGSQKRILPRLEGIETYDGMEIGEPSAIPDAKPRMVRKATAQNVKITGSGQIVSKGPLKLDRPLTQQERDILSRRSNHRRR